MYCERVSSFCCAPVFRRSSQKMRRELNYIAKLLTHSAPWPAARYVRTIVEMERVSLKHKSDLKSQTSSYSFVVSTQAGLVGALRTELTSLLAFTGKDTLASDVLEHERAIEFRGPWRLIYDVLFGSRLASGVAVRVREPFECLCLQDLLQGLRSAPWDSFILAADLPTVPITVSVDEGTSRLVETRSEVFAAVDAALSDLVVVKKTFRRRKVWSPYEHGLRVRVENDKCFLELNCSGRLSVRPFIYDSDAYVGSVGQVSKATEKQEKRSPVPFVVSPIHTPYQKEGGINTNAMREAPVWSLHSSIGVGSMADQSMHASKLQDLVAQEWHGTKDLAAPYAAAVVQQLPLQQVLQGLCHGDGMVIWDPFCGNGTLLLEIICTILRLRHVRSGYPFPCNVLLPHSGGDATAAADALGSKIDQETLDALGRLTVLGSDLSSSAIIRARKFLHRFCVYYKNQIPLAAARPERSDNLDSVTSPLPRLLRGPTILDDKPDRLEAPHRNTRTMQRRLKKRGNPRTDNDLAAGSQRSDAPVTSSLQAAELTNLSLQSFSSVSDPEWEINLPCEVSLNVASFERVGPHIAGAMIVTRIPREVRALGPTARIGDLHKRFSHFIASRSDWSAVYILAEGPDFKRHSRLPWEVLLKFTDHAGRKCQLLRLRHAYVHVGTRSK